MKLKYHDSFMDSKSCKRNVSFLIYDNSALVCSLKYFGREKYARIQNYYYTKLILLCKINILKATFFILIIAIKTLRSTQKSHERKELKKFFFKPNNAKILSYLTRTQSGLHTVPSTAKTPNKIPNCKELVDRFTEICAPDKCVCVDKNTVN